MKKKIAVIGAGPAGLSLAYSLLQRFGTLFDIILIEKEIAWGGINASFEKHGIYFDFGSHRLHPAVDEKILEDIKDMLGEGLMKRPRNGRIRIMDRFLRFPLSPLNAALNLPPRFLAGVMRDFLSKPFRRNKPQQKTFEDILICSLGWTICDSFYFPYAEKLWGQKPSLLHAEQAKRRIANNSIGKILKKTFSKLTGRKHTAFFYYPVNGIGAITDAYADQIVKMGGILMTGKIVSRINILKNSRFLITTDKVGTVDAIQKNNNQVDESVSLEFDFVFSTIPLDRLVQMITPVPPTAIISAADGLHYRGMLFCYIIFEITQFTEYDAHYFPETEYIFSRISETKNYYNSSIPENITGICCEIPCDVDDSIWNMPEKQLVERVVLDLKKCGLPATARVKDAFVKKNPSVYPIYNLDFEEKFKTVDAFFSEMHHFVLLGRQGLFVHDNLHHTIDMGYKASKCISENLEWDKNQWRIYREGFKENVIVD